MSTLKETLAVSVIMLTYNREQYVGRAVDSILCQTFKDFEFIIVDNGSNDNSGNICDDYAEKDSRIKVIHKERGNIGSGRNVGLLISQGEYITFIDDDDTAEPDMIEFLYDLITKYNADISVCGSWRSTDGVLTPKFIYDEILELNTEQAVVELLKREHYNVGFPTKMFRRSLLMPHFFPEKGCYDDITTSYKIFAGAYKIVALGAPKYIVYRHGNNNSAFATNYKLLKPGILDEYLTAFQERTKYLSEKFPEIKDYIQYTEWSYMISMCEKIIKYEIIECKKQYAYMRDNLKVNLSLIESILYFKSYERIWLSNILNEAFYYE